MARRVLMLLGINLWLLFDLIPAGRSLRPEVIALALLPLLPLLSGLRRKAGSTWLLAVFPLALLLPSVLDRSLTAEREITPLLAGLLALSLLAFLIAAGTSGMLSAASARKIEMEHVPAPTRLVWGNRIAHALNASRLTLLVLSLGLLMYCAGLQERPLTELREAFGDHLAEARIALLLIAFLIWMLLVAGSWHLPLPLLPPRDLAGSAQLSERSAPIGSSMLELASQVILLASLAPACYGIDALSRLLPGRGAAALAAALLFGRLAAVLGGKARRLGWLPTREGTP